MQPMRYNSFYIHRSNCLINKSGWVLSKFCMVFVFISLFLSLRCPTSNMIQWLYFHVNRFPLSLDRMCIFYILFDIIQTRVRNCNLIDWNKMYRNYSCPNPVYWFPAHKNEYQQKSTTHTHNNKSGLNLFPGNVHFS